MQSFIRRWRRFNYKTEVFIFDLLLGVAFPAVHSLISKWTPANEQSRAVAIVTAASYFGAILAFMLSSPIAAAIGWPWIFYTFAGLGLIWSILWNKVIIMYPKKLFYK